VRRHPWIPSPAPEETSSRPDSVPSSTPGTQDASNRRSLRSSAAAAWEDRAARVRRGRSRRRRRSTTAIVPSPVAETTVRGDGEVPSRAVPNGKRRRTRAAHAEPTASSRTSAAIAIRPRKQVGGSPTRRTGPAVVAERDAVERGATPTGKSGSDHQTCNTIREVETRPTTRQYHPKGRQAAPDKRQEPSQRRDAHDEGDRRTRRRRASMRRRRRGFHDFAPLQSRRPRFGTTHEKGERPHRVSATPQRPSRSSIRTGRTPGRRPKPPCAPHGRPPLETEILRNRRIGCRLQQPDSGADQHDRQGVGALAEGRGTT
jgi:hypothetical protein